MARAAAAVLVAIGIGWGALRGRVWQYQHSCSQPQKQEPVIVSWADYDLLTRRHLTFPVPGVDPRSIRDTFNDIRGNRRHEATDIAAPAGTPVVAVDDGNIRKLFLSARGGLTVYQFDSTGTYCYYYAHLQQYAPGLQEGKGVKRCDTIGYVGTSGDAAANDPHLHFAIFKLGPGRRWWEGSPLNPYPILTDSRPSSWFAVPAFPRPPYWAATGLAPI